MKDLLSISTRRMTGVAVATAAVAFAVVQSGCDRGQAQNHAPQGPPPPPPQVTVAPVQERELIEWDEFTGRTVPAAMVEVRSRVSGHVQEVRFRAGQTVEKGDVLFTIDPRWHKATLDQTMAAYEGAKVRLENAEKETQRTSKLLTTGAISKEEAEAREARFQEAKSAVALAVATRDSAKLDLEYTEVKSPIRGRISRELVTAGNYVSGNAGSATVLASIVSVDPIHVYADVDENSLLKFNGLQRAKKLASDANGNVPVELQLADESGFPHKGRIESFDNHVDPASGSILLRAEFPNPDGNIVPGLFARIRIPGSAKYQAVLVDEKAIGTDQAQKFVLTLTSSNTVAYRAVKLGPVVDGHRIVRDGLKPGDKVVVNGLQRVRPGSPVTPMEATNNTKTASAKAQGVQTAQTN